MRPSHRFGVAAVLASVTAAASVTLAGTASADPPLNETFHDEFTDTITDYCDVPGLTVQSEVVVDGRVLIHSGVPGPKFMEHTTGTFVDTNVANGNAVTGTFRTVQRALEGTDNGDGTLTVLFLATGNDVVYGPDGKAIARNPGQVRFELLIDHNGTPDDPTDDEVLAFLGVVKESTGRTDDFCAAVVPALTG
ncbi:MAG TPA: hypothetical protein VFZ68_02685 [Acidimicrobiales bacterium]